MVTPPNLILSRWESLETRIYQGQDLQKLYRGSKTCGLGVADKRELFRRTISKEEPKNF
jgi:hypothetical protein